MKSNHTSNSLQTIKPATARRTAKSGAAIESLEHRIVPAGVFKWGVDASAPWNNANHWVLVSGDAGVGYPNSLDDTAIFSDVASAPRTAVIPDGVTIEVGSIQFNDNNNYTISSLGSGKLRLGSEGISVTNTAGGDAHVIGARVEVSNFTFLLVPQNTSLTFTQAVEDRADTAFGDGFYIAGGGGTVTFSGSAPNTFNGALYIDSGVVNLSKTANVPALGESAYVQVGAGSGAASAAKLVFTASGQTHPDSTTLSVETDGEVVLGTTEQNILSLGMVTGRSVGGSLISASAGGKLGVSYVGTSTSFYNDGSSPATINAPIELLGNVLLNVEDSPGASDLILKGPISGVGQSLTKFGPGTLEISPTAASTYTGVTVVNEGTLTLAGATSDAAISKDIFVDPGATLRVATSFELPDAGSLTLKGNSQLIIDDTDDLTNLTLVSDTTGSPQIKIAGTEIFSIRTGGHVSVSGSGLAPALISGAGSFRFAKDNTGLDVSRTNAPAEDLLIQTQVLETTPGTLLNIGGNGTIRFSGDVKTTGVMQLNGATVIADANVSAPIALAGGTLKGIGAVGEITSVSGGRVDPGNSILDTANVHFTASDVFGVTIGNGSAGRLSVTGTVELNNAALDLSLLTISASQSAFTILANDGNDAISGRFAGLPNSGDTVVTPRGNYTISYTGGTGNDVTLTPVFVTPTISADGKTATYTDVDGDLVSVKTTKGKFNSSQFTIRAAGVGGVLQDLALNNVADGFENTRLTITAALKGGLGNKHADVGRINATGVDLAAVLVPGNLDVLVAGDSDVNDLAGLGLLTVDSIGIGRNDAGSTASVGVNGPAGTVWIKGDAVNANLTFGGVKSFKLGGSLTKTAQNATSSSLFVNGSAGTIAIGGDLLGGNTTEDGAVRVTGDLASITVKGSLYGDKGLRSGSIDVTGKLGKVAIGGSLHGGSATSAGGIYAGGGIGTATIAGSVFGGEGFISGSVSGTKGITSLAIGGDVQGGEGSRSGSISALNGAIAKLTVKGSVVGNALSDGGLLANKLGTVAIGKDLRGYSDGTVLSSTLGS